MYKARLDKVRAALAAQNLDGVLVCDPTSIRYLTGAMIHPMERMWLLYIGADGSEKLFANRLFVFPDTGLPTLWHSDTDDAPALLCEALSGVKRLGVDRGLTAKYLLPLLAAEQGRTLTVASSCVDDLRIIKDEQELQLMRESSRINDAVLQSAVNQLREGMTEKELAAIIAAGYEAAGCDGQSFGTIAAFGANAADPHHMTDNTPLRRGDAVLIDMGAKWQGYCSDMTRTCFFGEVSDKQREVYEIVREAFEKAKATVRAGVRFCDIDAAARDHITAAGYGEYFTHRLGHCIGLEDHEPQDVSSVNTNTVSAGMVFSIEPGIYLPGAFGVRIEDLVIVTEDGYECLNALPTVLEVK